MVALGGFTSQHGFDPTSGIYSMPMSYYNPNAAAMGISGPLSMSVPYGGGGGGSALGGGGSALMGGLDLTSMLAQILQQGPSPDSALLESSMGDIDAQQQSTLNTLKNRFSGTGRPLSSTEYGSQESELLNAFSRARSAARANASQAGLSSYAAKINPLLSIIKLMQTESPVFSSNPTGAYYQNLNIPRY